MLSWMFVIAGAALSLWSALIGSRVNAGIRMPYWGRPERDPGWSMALRATGLGLAMFGVGTLAFANTIQLWTVPLAVPLIIAVLLPGLLVIPIHNRNRVEAR